MELTMESNIDLLLSDTNHLETPTSQVKILADTAKQIKAATITIPFTTMRNTKWNGEILTSVSWTDTNGDNWKLTNNNAQQPSPPPKGPRQKKTEKKNTQKSNKQAQTNNNNHEHIANVQPKTGHQQEERDQHRVNPHPRGNWRKGGGGRSNGHYSPHRHYDHQSCYDRDHKGHVRESSHQDNWRGQQPKHQHLQLRPQQPSRPQPSRPQQARRDLTKEESLKQLKLTIKQEIKDELEIARRPEHTNGPDQKNSDKKRTEIKWEVSQIKTESTEPTGGLDTVDASQE